MHPESDHLDSLKELARREGDEEMRVFKSELREALRDPSQLPGDELFESVEYDGSDEAFLRLLWHELYGDEPLKAPPGLFHPDPEFRSWTLENSWPWCRAPASPPSAAGGH